MTNPKFQCGRKTKAPTCNTWVGLAVVSGPSSSTPEQISFMGKQMRIAAHVLFLKELVSGNQWNPYIVFLMHCAHCLQQFVLEAQMNSTCQPIKGKQYQHIVLEAHMRPICLQQGERKKTTKPHPIRNPSDTSYKKA